MPPIPSTSALVASVGEWLACSSKVNALDLGMARDVVVEITTRLDDANEKVIVLEADLAKQKKNVAHLTTELVTANARNAEPDGDLKMKMKDLIIAQDAAKKDRKSAFATQIHHEACQQP